MSRRKKPNRPAPLPGLYLRGRYWWFQPPTVDRFRAKPFSLETADENDAIAQVLAWRKKPALREMGRWDAEVELHLEERKIDKRLSHMVISARRSVLKAFGRSVKVENPAQVTTAMCQRWYDSLRKGTYTRKGETTPLRYSERTPAEYLMIVKAFFDWLVAKRKVAENPFDEVRTVRVMKVARKDFVEKMSVRRLLAAARLETRYAKRMVVKVREGRREVGDPTSERSAMDKVRLARETELMLYMGFDAGFRKNEIIHATPKWFAKSAKSVNVSKTPWFEPKVRQERTVPLTNRFQRFLRREFPQGLPAPWVLNPDILPGENKDYRFEPGPRLLNFMKRWDIRSVEGRLPHLHMARHSFASNRLIAKQDPFRVAEWIGDTMDMLQFHYGHLMADDPEVNRGV